MKLRKASLLGFLVLIAVSCHSQKQEYPFKGEVISIDRTSQRATIKHEDIPGYMEGMTMSFVIKDPEAIRSLNPGDFIEATLIVSNGRSWLENVHIQSKRNA